MSVNVVGLLKMKKVLGCDIEGRDVKTGLWLCGEANRNFIIIYFSAAAVDMCLLGSNCSKQMLSVNISLSCTNVVYNTYYYH